MRVRRFILGALLLTLNFGCLNLTSNFLDDPMGSPTAHKQSSKDAVLPAKECSEICVALGADLEKNGFLADAVIQYEKARSLDPKLKVASRRLAVLYDQLGEERKALAEYEEALKRTPKDADLINDFGYFHFSRGRWSQAETCFRQAVAINPNLERANINLGMTLAQQDKLDEAFKVFVKVNSQAQAKANIAFALATQGKRDLAIRTYREALQMEPGLICAQQALATLENGGKVNLLKGSPANRPVNQSVRDALEASIKPESLAAKDSIPDSSPLIVAPKR